VAAEPRVVAGPAEDPDGTDPARRAGARLALAMIDGYKLLISPYFAGSCRFLPSCADYAREAVIRHGALRGTWLAARRLSRCQPLCAGGHDPVPLNRN
jgi:putative membrane protein insertion efficiency factor